MCLEGPSAIFSIKKNSYLNFFQGPCNSNMWDATKETKCFNPIARVNIFINQSVEEREGEAQVQALSWTSRKAWV